MIEVFLNLGFEVDLVSEKNGSFKPSRRYDVLMAMRFDLERLAGLVNDDCLKIVHLETADTLFHCRAELSRLMNLQDRHSVTLRPYRLETPHRALEVADFATLTGNAYTLSTYRNAKIPIYLTPAAPPFLYEWPERKDFERSRKRFLFMASEGLVHKGLDLVLDAFSQMPDLELVVCGRVLDEPDFVRAFKRELTATPNIRMHGWVDTGSPQFEELAASCCAMVYPSSSEGQSGALLTAMHAGLIPIASRQSGVDLPGFGRILEESSISEIREAVRVYSSLSPEVLRQESRAAWEFARAHHTQEEFARVYHGVVVQMLESRGLLPAAAVCAPANSVNLTSPGRAGVPRTMAR
jgi:glycosyltransferase involved in cell wall biosynthesis